MTLAEQTRFMELFHSACLAIIKSKNPDYAPDGIPLLDAMAGGVDMNISVPQLLWVLYRKHFSAIRKHFNLDQPLTSEPVATRLQDAANYFGFLAFYDTYKLELHSAWRRHWEKQKCECAYVVRGIPTHDFCEKCRSLLWLERQAFRLGSGPTSSRSTQKERG